MRKILKQNFPSDKDKCESQLPILVFDNSKIKTDESPYYHLCDSFYSKNPFKEVGKAKIFFHGTLYNKNELKQKYSLPNNIEVEIVGDLYNKFGMKVAELLDGAFCVLIVQENSIIMFRDYFGLEPFYYSLTKNNSFIISNNISGFKSLLKLELNTSFLPYYFLNNDLTNWNTIYRDINLVPLYEIVTYKKNEGKLYFDFIGNSPFHSVEALTTKDIEVGKTIENLLVNRVFDLVKSRKEVFNMMSGGIDSSYVSVILKDKGYLESISASFENIGKDEEYARGVVNHLALKHQYISINENNFYDGIIEALVRSETPYAYKGEAFFFNIFKKIADQNYVDGLLLNGTGADAIFSCGKELKILQIVKSFPIVLPLIKPLNFSAQNLMEILPKDYQQNYFSEDLMYLYLGITSKKLNEVKKILGLINLPDIFSREIDIINHSPTNLLDKISRLHAYYSLTRIPNVLNVIAKSLNLSIVYPFMFKDLFEFLLRLPIGERVTFSTKKYYLRKLLSKRLPQKIINRKKLDMEVPFLEMFNNNKHFKVLIKEIRDAKYDFLNVDSELIFKSPQHTFHALKLINIHMINKKIINH